MSHQHHQFTIAIEEPTKSAVLCVSDKAARHRHSLKHDRATAMQSALHSAVKRGYQFTNEQCNFSLVSATMNKSKITFVLGEATVFSFNPATGVGKVAPINDNETVFQMAPTNDGKGFAQGTNNWKVMVNDEVVFSGCVDCFDQIMAAHTAVADQKSSHRWTVRLPLYSAAGLEECTRLRLPVHEVHLALGSKQHRSKKTFEIKIKEVLFFAFGSPTSAWFNPQGQHTQRLVAQVSHTGMYSAASFSSFKAPEPTMLGASELQMRGSKTVQSILVALGSTTVDKYSLSVYQRDRALFTIESGGDTSRHRYALGSVSEVVFAAAFVDYVNKSGIVKSPIVDFNDPDLLEILLERSGARNVLAGLRSLYSSTKQRPSISQLMCHSSGLPAHAPLLAEHLKQAVLRGSGFAEKQQQQVFSLEAAFGQMLTQDIQLEAPPGARVSPSALGYALLSFALPNWHESTSLTATLDALGLSGFEYGNDPSSDAYQGIYRLGSGMTLDAQTLARALSGGNNTWFRSSVSQKRADGLDFLQEMLVPRYTINKKAKLSASFGWTHSVVQSTRGSSVHVASAVSTLVSGETVAAIMIPALEVSAVFALKNTSTLVQFNAAAMKQLVDGVLDTQMGSGVSTTTFKYHMPPFHQTAVVFARQCSDALHTGCIVEQEDTTLNSYYNGEFVSVFDEEAVTMSIGIEFTQPGDKRRYVLTLKWHDRITKWLLAFDKHGSVAPNKEERGVYRIVDPTNQKFLGAYVYFQSIASTKRNGGASASVIREPIVSFDGRVFARVTLVEKIRRFGEPSSLEQRQTLVVEIKRREEQRAALAAKKTKKAQRKQRQPKKRSDSSSSDSSSDSDEDTTDKDQDDAATKRFKQAIANQEDFFLVLSSIDNDVANETTSPEDIGHPRRPRNRPPPPRRHHGGHRHSGFWPGWLAGTATGLALSLLAPVYSYPYSPPGHYYDPYYDPQYYGPRYAW